MTATHTPMARFTGAGRRRTCPVAVGRAPAAARSTRPPTVLLALLALWLAACSGNTPHEPPEPPPEPSSPEFRYQAEIRRTSYGIPHIKADDWGGLGYGYGFAYAQDNFCVAMRAIVFATSRSAEFFGEDDGDVTSDFVLRFLFGTKEEFRENYLQDRETPAFLLTEGFAAG